MSHRARMRPLVLAGLLLGSVLGCGGDSSLTRQLPGVWEVRSADGPRTVLELDQAGAFTLTIHPKLDAGDPPTEAEAGPGAAEKTGAAIAKLLMMSAGAPRLSGDWKVVDHQLLLRITERSGVAGLIALDGMSEGDILTLDIVRLSERELVLANEGRPRTFERKW